MAPSSTRPPSRWRLREVVLLGGSLYLMVVASQLAVQEVRLQHYTVDLKTQRAAVEDERRTLNRQLELYRQDAGIERLARQHLGMARANEVPVRFVDANSGSGQPAPTTAD